MSGLLDRLAAQALDVPPRMRPAARLRGSTSELSAEIIPHDTDPFAPSRAPETLTLPPAPGIKPAQEDTRAVPLPVPSAAEADSRLSKAFRLASRVDPPLVSAPTRVHCQLEEYSRSNPLAAPTIPAIEPHDASASVDRQVAQPVTRVAPRSVDLEEITPLRTPPQTGALKPLLPRRSTFSVEVPVRVRRQDAVQQHVPDVHIHINRVELTAVTAPAPPHRTNSAQTKKPMSLDEYLQRRNRKIP